MWATCVQLESIFGYKVMVITCHKLNTSVNDDLIRHAKIEMEELTAEIISLATIMIEMVTIEQLETSNSSQQLTGNIYHLERISLYLTFASAYLEFLIGIVGSLCCDLLMMCHGSHLIT